MWCFRYRHRRHRTQCEARPRAEDFAAAPRLLLGVVPPLLAWLALLLPQAAGLWVLALGVLATAIMYPVVPRGDDSIRFQISAEHTAADIDEALAALQNAR